MNNLLYKNAHNILTLKFFEPVNNARKFLTHFIDGINQTVTNFLYA